MDTYTHFEDLSNEIFFEIFDYFHALDIFTSFTSLNQRISSILQLIPLRIIITIHHYRHEISFLSSCLTGHAHQVISIKTHDTIRDYSSTINLLFNRHNFINLESCTFISINSSTKLENIIQQIQNLNRLVSFTIRQPYDKNINENDKNDLTRIILMHKSSSLRSVELEYRYNYLDISSYTSISSNLTSLNLRIFGSRSIVSVYSILSILRLCHTVRYLRITIEHDDLVENNNVNNSIQTPSINDNNLPMLPQMMSFYLKILAVCDSRSIGYILRCMPNLIHFYFKLAIRKTAWPFPNELLDGYVWQQMLERYVPCLSKFEFHISIMKRYPKLDLDIIINSFEYFVRKYSNWHMIIDRWNCQSREECVILRTFNYHKYKSKIYASLPFIHCGTFQTRSTTTTNDHYLFYSNITNLGINMGKKSPTITWSSPLFQQINYLIVRMPRIHSSLWNNLLNMVNFHQTNDNHDIQQSVTYLSHFVHLPNVILIEFQSKSDLPQWEYIQFILEACPNVMELIINTRLLLLSKLIDNPSLIPIFQQIKMIKSITENIYFPSNFALKFVQRFPSLSQIKLRVFSFDICVSVINIFLTHLKNLYYLNIDYNQDTLLDDPFSCDYIVEKRRQTFPNNIIDEQRVNVKNNGKVIEIWLL